MRTVVLGPQPPELEALIARRRALGQDTHDEVWEGDYHMAPAPLRRHARVAAQLIAIAEQLVGHRGLEAVTEVNIGMPGNFRVPDGAVLHPSDGGEELYISTAAMVFEVLSPDDETWQKFDHYAVHSVIEVVVADLARRTIDLFVLDGTAYQRSDFSDVLGVSSGELHDMIRWPT